jgi:hypothetical protein
MAKRTVTTYYSDLSGATVDENHCGTRFSLDGVDYEIDLTASERAALGNVLAPYISAARRLRQATQAGRLIESPTSSEPTPGELRAWAEVNGFVVSSRGRVPEMVREAYRASQPVMGLGAPME